MKVNIFLLILFLSCTTNKPVNKNLLLSLLSDSTGSVTAYFSYPGRYIEEEKRETYYKLY
ncbi:MAG: hypothetical protein IPH52_28180 [Leptospiraceae bacterium]|nr:hypothetical protein [Leptospiraceae bacterium]